MTGESASRPMTALTRYFAIDWPRGSRQPRMWRFLLAAIVAVVGSEIACIVLAALGPIVFPSTAGYDHFQFADYTKLTVAGVIIASIAWPLATLVSSRAAKPLFLWATVVVTVVSFAPDAWILFGGQNAEAILVLAVMHVAVALITYPALVKIAPQPKA